MAAIGYEKARNLMRQLDWKMRVTSRIVDYDVQIESIELYHPLREGVYRVRKDMGLKLMGECRVCKADGKFVSILCYDHDGSNEDLV